MKKILVIEDDRVLAGSLYRLLSPSYSVDLASTVDEVYSRLKTQRFDLIVSDRMLHTYDTLEMVTYIRDTYTETRLLCISQLRSVRERVHGLKEGFDEYLPKPFSTQELELKIEKLLNFQRASQNESMQFGMVQFNQSNGYLLVDGDKTQLRRKEYQIFNCLVRYRNQVVTREKLFSAAWSDEITPCDTTLEVYIRKLRIKLKTHAYLIKTIRGYGYVLSY